MGRLRKLAARLADKLTDKLEGEPIREDTDVIALEGFITNLKDVTLYLMSYGVHEHHLRHTDKKKFASGDQALTEILEYLKDRNTARIDWHDYELEYELREKGKEEKKHTLRINIDKYPITFRFQLKGTAIFSLVSLSI